MTLPPPVPDTITVDGVQWPDATFDDWGSAAESFARGRLDSGVRAHADPMFPGVLDDMRKAGFPELCADTRLDGLAESGGALARALEPIAAHDADAAFVIYANAAAHLAIVASSVPDSDIRDLPAASDGWLAWPAFHDIGEHRWPRFDGRTLTGGCPMIGAGGHAGHAVIPASGPGGSLHLVLVDLDADGVTVSAPVRTLGLSASGIVDVTFRSAPGLVVTSDAAGVLDAIGGHLAVASMAMLCGVMRASLSAATAYAYERSQGGGPILGWDEVRRLLSVQQERLRAAQGLLTSTLTDDAGEAEGAALSARYRALHVGALAADLTTDGVQLLGGNGYIRAYGQERHMRDARQLHGLGGGPAWRRQHLLIPASAPVSGV